MTSFTASADALLYEERGRTAGLRSLFALAAVIAIAASLVFVVLMRAAGPLDTWAKFGGLAASIAGLLAFWAFGAFCLRVAFFVPQQRARFDRALRRITYTTRSPARGERSRVHAFAEVTDVRLLEEQTEDGPAFAVIVALAAAKPLRLGLFDDRAAADAALAQVRQALAPAGA